MIDTHCHLNLLDLAPFNGSEEDMITDMLDHGVKRVVCISIDLETLPEVLSFADRYDAVYASVGVHPSSSLKAGPDVDTLVMLAQKPKVVAIGETGLDYHYNDSGLENMREQFRTHIQAAQAVKRPLIIHTRAAQKDTIQIMQDEQARDVGGIMHCFTETQAMAKASMDMGFYISFSGIVTFKNAANVQAVAEYVPLDRMLIETDAPYLTPVPFRGKPNRPSYVRFVAEKIAELKQCSVEKVMSITTDNAIKVFQW
tara:strand:+ start:267 stop:1034 length:768 start_codon:yes stop_codon:yes gene_type:complete